MKQLRILVCAFVGALLGAALLFDGTELLDFTGVSGSFDREPETLAVPRAYSVPVPSATKGTWFCPGGSDVFGRADITLEITNASPQPATAIVSAIRNGSGLEPRESMVTIDAGDRTLVRLADLVTDSAWMGAVVEVDSPDVIVEQTYIEKIYSEQTDVEQTDIEETDIGAEKASDRGLCHTRTSDHWVIASGATRLAAQGEEMILLVMNPFPHDAVLDVRFDSDAGVDTLKGVVIPARRVVAIDVTELVPAASRVSVVIDALVGQVAVARLQSQGLGATTEQTQAVNLSVTPATSAIAPVWYLLDLNSDNREDLVTVVNPSLTETAEVDLEIISDDTLNRDPVELTIGPGAASQVRLSDLERLSGVGSYGITARSLSGVPIAVMHKSTTLAGTDLPLAGGSVAATSGLDVTSQRWLAPLASGSHNVVVFNPSQSSIALVEVAVIAGPDRRVVGNFEIAPLGRVSLPGSELSESEGEGPIVEVVASLPVVVSRDLSGVSQHQLLPAVVAGDAVAP